MTQYKNTEVTDIAFDKTGKIIGAKGFYMKIPGHKKIVIHAQKDFWKAINVEYVGESDVTPN